MSDETPTTSIALPASRIGPDAAESRLVQRYGAAAAAQKQDLGAMLAVARKFWASGMMPAHVKREEDAIAIALRGAELGLPVIQSWHSMYVVKGRVGMESKMMLGLAYKLLPGFQLVVGYFDVEGRLVHEYGPERVTLTARRTADAPWVTVSFTIEEARAAGYTERYDRKKGKTVPKETWAKVPADMLAARCTARLLRLVAPDAFQGLYDREEIAEMRTEEPIAIESVEVVSPVVVTETGPEPIDVEAVDRENIVAELTEESVRGDVKRAAADLELDMSSVETVAGLRPFLDALDTDTLTALHKRTFAPLAKDEGVEENPD